MWGVGSIQTGDELCLDFVVTMVTPGQHCSQVTVCVLWSLGCWRIFLNFPVFSMPHSTVSPQARATDRELLLGTLCEVLASGVTWGVLGHPSQFSWFLYTTVAPGTSWQSSG